MEISEALQKMRECWNVNFFYAPHIRVKRDFLSLEKQGKNQSVWPQCETQTIRILLPSLKCFFLRLEFLRIYLGRKNVNLLNT